jgi:hypothetical protein
VLQRTSRLKRDVWIVSQQPRSIAEGVTVLGHGRQDYLSTSSTLEFTQANGNEQEKIGM